ncbi:hypothetical protein MLD38_012842 [Melastoma candidum]|uniref:Uncharacterized protein n=1 Tax=Melastoma candidum TaxID=119954 RepID=A0ACB9R7N6_9MYRT|nr:hypothetical protein MLD38_012842 [Melastoma candidum]
MCLSPSRPPTYSSSQSSRKENVEDVWKEINLTSLPVNPIATTSTTGNGTGISAAAKPCSFLGSMFLDYLGKEREVSSDRTSTDGFLSLNSASRSQYIGMENIAGPLTSSCKKRVTENAVEFREKKFKRLMKNRESAARSRARKQAYTNELELEVARLQKENARLRRLREMLLANHPQYHKKSSLHRTLTCPF